MPGWRRLSLAGRPSRTTLGNDLGFWSTAQVVVRRDPNEDDLAISCRLPSGFPDQPRMCNGL
jgi:hypothetical protein